MKDLARFLCLFGTIDSFIQLPECSSKSIGVIQDTGLDGLSPSDSGQHISGLCCVLVLSKEMPAATLSQHSLFAGVVAAH